MQWTRRIVLLAAAALVGMQTIRPQRSNRPVDPSRTIHRSGLLTPGVEPILDRSCDDCHSDKTVWPWYAQIAPVSWLLAAHVSDGRRALNFSQWSTYGGREQARKIADICKEARSGAMPLRTYLPLHPAARLSDDDRRVICTWSDQQLAQLARRGITPLPRGR